jgi:hypothetical protein
VQHDKNRNTGLIKREEGKYTLTAFGRIIYDIALAAMENAVNNYWKLKAIESLRMSKNLPAAECKKIIDTFIDNQQIKDILVRDDNISDSTLCRGIATTFIPNLTDTLISKLKLFLHKKTR